MSHTQKSLTGLDHKFILIGQLGLDRALEHKKRDRVSEVGEIEEGRTCL